jgi:hypothetical protein
MSTDASKQKGARMSILRKFRSSLSHRSRMVVLFGSVMALAVTASALAASALPPAPILTAHPAKTTTSRTATFTYYDTAKQSIFICSLDSTSARSWGPCADGLSHGRYLHAHKTYHNLRLGKHTFRLAIVHSRFGHPSKTTTFTWTIKAR